MKESPSSPVASGFSRAASDPPQTTFVADEDDPEEHFQPAGGGGFKESFLAEVRRSKLGFYQMTVAQAHRIEVQGDRVVFEFTPVHRMMRDQLEGNRSWLEPLASRLAGRRMLVTSALVDAPAATSGGGSAEPGGRSAAGPSEELKAEAAAIPDMKTLLELLPLDIRNIEKM
jgi:hypothetical protein